MATLIQCTSITHSAGTRRLFNGLDLTIDSQARIGLVGHNGAGKSTLLGLINGSQQPDSGDISRSAELHLETLEQFIEPRLNSLRLIDALMDKMAEEERPYSAYKVERVLQQLGFAPGEYQHHVEDLSGGQQNRLMFGRAIINSPNLILFDEPTNHLDLSTLLFFEAYLRDINAAFLLISHDRQFLDAVTSSTVILRDERAYHFALPCSAARERLREQDDAALARRKEEEKALKSLKASQKRLAEWGKVYDNEKIARKAKNMEKRIDRLEAAKTFVSQGTGLNLSLTLETSRASRILQIEDRDVTAPDASALFHIKDFYLRPGDRVALLGHNGAGKTTLIQQIVRSFHQDDGFARFNPQCKLGYYDQEMAELAPARSLLETLRDHCHGTEQDYTNGLIHAGFPYADFDKRAGVLSGGEKARLMFLILKLNQANFLILDEPTNHIDIQGKEELEEQLLASGATLLVTSHDRRFVSHMATRYLWIHEGRLEEINDPETFYVSEKPDLVATTSLALSDKASTSSDESEEAVLQQIIDLEQRLADDLARKPKFQKPALQTQWRAEIARLNALLD